MTATFGLCVATVLAGCERTQAVALTAEDFRFTPDVVRVSASTPITLTVYNAGRETHEFDSQVLIYAPAANLPQNAKSSGASGVVLAPGQSLQLVMAPPPGTYLYNCRRKGHTNMSGTLIVE